MSKKDTTPLTPKQEAFARNVVAGMSTVDAYRNAGYSIENYTNPNNVYNKANAVRREAKVVRRIKELQAELAREVVLERADMIREIRDLATSDIRGIVNDKGQIRLPHELDKATAAAISKFKMTFDGTIEYQFHSKTTALDQACKILGLYEQDNKQKTDPLADLLRSLGGKVLGPTADNSAREPEDGDD